MMYTFNEEKVYWDKKPIYTAPGKVISALSYEDNLILRYEVSSKDSLILSFEVANCNIISIDRNGTLLWRIKDRPGSIPSWFSQLNIEGEDAYIAGNVNGYEYRFNPKTGETMGSRFVG